jgi:hypothetical protein
MFYSNLSIYYITRDREAPDIETENIWLLQYNIIWAAFRQGSEEKDIYIDIRPI